MFVFKNSNTMSDFVGVNRPFTMRIILLKKCMYESVLILEVSRPESIFTDDVRLGKKYWVDTDKRMVVL